MDKLHLVARFAHTGCFLTDEWKASKDGAVSRFVWNLDQFNAVDPVDTEYLLGDISNWLSNDQKIKLEGPWVGF